MGSGRPTVFPFDFPAAPTVSLQFAGPSGDSFGSATFLLFLLGTSSSASAGTAHADAGSWWEAPGAFRRHSSCWDLSVFVNNKEINRLPFPEAAWCLCAPGRPPPGSSVPPSDSGHHPSSLTHALCRPRPAQRCVCSHRTRLFPHCSVRCSAQRRNRGRTGGQPVIPSRGSRFPAAHPAGRGIRTRGSPAQSS